MAGWNSWLGSTLNSAFGLTGDASAVSADVSAGVYPSSTGGMYPSYTGYGSNPSLASQPIFGLDEVESILIKCQNLHVDVVKQLTKAAIGLSVDKQLVGDLKLLREDPTVIPTVVAV